jgi:cobalt-precorrin 5A hydrolase
MEIVYDFFLQNKLSIKSLSTIATIDIKKKEEAFLYLSSQLNIPLITYSREELNECFEANKDLSSSPFVKKKVGVKGVCEPAAILGANNNKLLINKTIKEGVTLALAVIKPYFITTDDYSWFTMG